MTVSEISYFYDYPRNKIMYAIQNQKLSATRVGNGKFEISTRDFEDYILCEKSKKTPYRKVKFTHKDKNLSTVTQVSMETGLSVDKIYYMIRNNDIRYKVIDNHYAIDINHFKEILGKNEL